MNMTASMTANMTLQEFQKRYPWISEQIIERGWQAKHLIDQHGHRKGFRCVYGKREHSHLIDLEKPLLQTA
jgi:hypothetical protein